LELEAKQKIIRKKHVRKLSNISDVKEEGTIVRHTAGSKGLSSSLASIKDQNDQKVPQHFRTT